MSVRKRETKKKKRKPEAKKEPNEKDGKKRRKATNAHPANERILRKEIVAKRNEMK